MTDFSLSNENPRSLYIHIPFCRHRCGYCNFTLVAGRDYLVDRYLNAIETEINQLERQYKVDTVFLGGGTPSHLSADNLARLNSIIRGRFAFADNCEFTAECNPADLTEACAAALASCGVNRVSLGVQSLNDQKLKVLERDHKRETVMVAMENARRFAKSVSLDLIFATPNETFVDWKADLASAIKLQPDHFSTYELTFEKGTSFWTRRLQKEISAADEDLRCQMYEHAIDCLDENGFKQYEVSSFAKQNHECRHNLVYWSGLPYFAFGPGASSYLEGVRKTNHQSTMRYLQLLEAGKSPVADVEKLTPEDRAKELLAIGLRKLRGVELKLFASQTGFEVHDLLALIEKKLSDAKLIVFDDDSISLTRKGVLVCDWIAGEIVS